MIEKAKEKVCYLINFLSIALYFFLVSILEAHFEIAVFRYLGWILLAFGLLLIISSTLALIRKNIKKLIEDGIYGFIRHPMYLGVILIFFSWIFFFPHWIIFLLSSLNIGVMYWFILQGERQNIDKFGEEYKRYMQAVPRINILGGIYKRLRGSHHSW
jgi:protein-S-isoprenylcysteine O-methyltransferase Ste14